MAVLALYVFILVPQLQLITIKNGMEFVSDSEADEYFDDEEILFQTSQILCESEED